MGRKTNVAKRMSNIRIAKLASIQEEEELTNGQGDVSNDVHMTASDEEEGTCAPQDYEQSAQILENIDFSTRKKKKENDWLVGVEDCEMTERKP
jgi:hypothetical protein